MICFEEVFQTRKFSKADLGFEAGALAEKRADTKSEARYLHTEKDQPERGKAEVYCPNQSPLFEKELQ